MEPRVPPPPAPAPSRTIHEGDGLAWLRASALTDADAVVTSLPDASELRSLSFEAWRAWFVDTAALVCERTAAGSVSVFYQTDVRREGRWVDKGFLVGLGAERAGAACLFHKIVCRAAPGTATYGRPGYAHLLAFSKGLTTRIPEATPDVLPGLGHMPWSKAMGTAACEAVCDFLRRSTACGTVIDPFCGQGTMLAVANARGFHAVGVERSPRRAALARRLRWPLEGAPA